ncbi:MAG: glycoside hydrolase family 43 protein [Elusimicrobiota bacterium]
MRFISIINGCVLAITLSMEAHTLDNYNKIDLSTIQPQSDKFYTNPLNIKGIGDPFVLKSYDGKYYCYPTSASDGYRVWTSTDAIYWKGLGKVYTTKPSSWAKAQFWAPEVVEYNGKYYMYYSARSTVEKIKGNMHIGVAVSTSPAGPFLDEHNQPVFDYGYSVIDAHVFFDDDGKKYLYYSRDCSTNRVENRNESHIYGIELNDNMVSVKGEPVLLLKPEQHWEKPNYHTLWNEGPFMVKYKGTYYLMYSGQCYASRWYAVGYAVSQQPLGQFAKYPHNPILAAEWDKVSGPGHHSVFLSPDGKEMFIAYHTHTDITKHGSNRQLCIDRMGFREDGTIYANGPTLTPQPVPAGLSYRANIAPNAVVTASSVNIAYSKEAVNDGEVTTLKRFEKHEWVSSVDDPEPWIQLEWEKEHIVDTILIYPSILKQRKPSTAKLFFSNRTYIDNIFFPEEPGAAVIINLPDTRITWLKVVFEITNSTSTSCCGISEITILGK